VPELLPSLPPAADADTTLALSNIEDAVEKKPSWYLPPDSIIREKAIKIVAMRAGGMKPAEIAAALNIKESNIRPYVWRASKNGWITFDDPEESIEFQLLPKAIRNLNDALDDTVRHQTSGMTVGTQVALKVAEGTIFKKFDQVNAAAPTTIVAVRVEMPDGPRPQVREGNEVGGVPAHVDAEVVDVR
jgi:DNA-binding transcriptional regulator LsrR (DeoR family)